jgi:hypothetical protein
MPSIMRLTYVLTSPSIAVILSSKFGYSKILDTPKSSTALEAFSQMDGIDASMNS